MIRYFCTACSHWMPKVQKPCSPQWPQFFETFLSLNALHLYPFYIGVITAPLTWVGEARQFFFFFEEWHLQVQIFSILIRFFYDITLQGAGNNFNFLEWKQAKFSTSIVLWYTLWKQVFPNSQFSPPCSEQDWQISETNVLFSHLYGLYACCLEKDQFF